MTKKEIASVMKFAETIYSFYQYGYRWWGGIANEIIDKIGKPFAQFATEYKTARNLSNEGKLDEEAIASLLKAEDKLYSAILHSGVFSTRYFAESEPINSKGRKVGLYEIIRRIRDAKATKLVA